MHMEVPSNGAPKTSLPTEPWAVFAVQPVLGALPDVPKYTFAQPSKHICSNRSTAELMHVSICYEPECVHV